MNFLYYQDNIKNNLISYELIYKLTQSNIKPI